MNVYYGSKKCSSETEGVVECGGWPQRTVLGPTLFCLKVNDIQLADPRKNLMVKYADGITITIPVSKYGIDATTDQVNSMKYWSASKWNEFEPFKNVENAGTQQDYEA